MYKDSKYNRENVGTIINALRLEMNMGQDEMAKALGISQGTVSKIEHGTLELGLSLYYDFLNYFKLDAEAFSDLVDRYIKVTLRAQQSKIKADHIQRFIKDELDREIKQIRAAR